MYQFWRMTGSFAIALACHFVILPRLLLAHFLQPARAACDIGGALSRYCDLLDALARNDNRCDTKYYVFAGYFVPRWRSIRIFPARLHPIRPSRPCGFTAAWTDRTNARRYVAGLAITLGCVAFILTIPPWYLFLRRTRDEFISHSAQISIFAPDESGNDPVRALLQKYMARLEHVSSCGGCRGSLRNLPGRPIFDPFLGVLFLAGIGFMWLYTLIAPRIMPGPLPGSAARCSLARGCDAHVHYLATDAPNFIRTLAGISGDNDSCPHGARLRSVAADHKPTLQSSICRRSSSGLIFAVSAGLHLFGLFRSSLRTTPLCIIRFDHR